MEDEEHIRRIVRVAIHELFETVGVDVATPEGRKLFRDNMDWVQSFRTGASNAKTAILGVGLTSFFGGAFWLLWEGLKTAVTIGNQMKP